MLLTSIITQIYVNLLQFSIEQYSLKTIGLYGCNPSVYQFSSLSVPWRIVRVDSPATSTMRFCQMLASYPCPASLLSMTNQDCIYWTIISFLIWSLVASDRCPPWFEETVSQSLLRHTNHEFAIQELWLLNVDTLCLELRTLSDCQNTMPVELRSRWYPVWYLRRRWPPFIAGQTAPLFSSLIE